MIDLYCGCFFFIQDDLNGQISRLRAENDEKVEGLERRLEVALGMYTTYEIHSNLNIMNLDIVNFAKV